MHFKIALDMRGRELLSILLMAAGAECLRWPKVFKDGMIIQADPTSAILWGFLDGNTNTVESSASCQLKGRETFPVTKTFSPTQDDTIFKFEFPGEHGLTCSFKFTQEGSDDLTLNFVTYGDVWVCSGQSNMEWSMGSIFDFEAEIADIANYHNIRLYKLPHMGHPQPQEDLMSEDFTIWASTNQTQYVSRFSAICLLTIKNMAQKLPGKHFGLIETNWGGTRIEPWMTPEGLAACDIEPSEDDNNVGNSDTYLYNAMIHPLVRMSIKGALWYQGEANTNRNRDKYQCSFPAMISEWRRVWSMMSLTGNQFPFGFVQLSTWNANDMSPGFPMIRWHQTGDFGFVPNDEMKNVFMAVALDTYDNESGIHPRNKQLPAKRLATSGLNVAYGLADYPTNGPFPDYVEFFLVEDGFSVTIDYDQDFKWNVVESVGFYYCCEEDFEMCNNVNGAWQKVEPSAVTQSGRRIQVKLEMCATGLAYLWETTPVLGTAALPLYADNPFELPGAPWIRQVAV